MTTPTRTHATDERQPGTLRAGARIAGQPGLLRASARHWLVVVGFGLVGLVSGIAVVQASSPTYSATATLAVSNIDINAPGALSGFTSAASSLSQTYSRAVFADEVIDSVARELDLPAAEVRNRIEAAPLPNSPLFRVTASGDDPESARAVANNASTALLDYLAGTAASGAAEDEILDRYRAVIAEVSQSSIKRRRLEQLVASQEDPARQDLERLGKATSELEALRLQSQDLSAQYRQARQRISFGQLVTLVSSAPSATSNQASRLQFYGLLGLFGGILSGIAAAVLLDSRRRAAAQSAYARLPHVDEVVGRSAD